jgi:hypothetical protein
MDAKKSVPVMLRSLGLDEKWLQDQISRDPALLGLGELEIAAKEHHQPLGGRIDFLMRNAEAETFYEVEIMLGSLDESHIIRTIEYWDIERQRRPTFEHRAVIVAERITARFFNVLRLLNRAVPMIAVQLSAFRSEDNTIVLHPVTVLDVIEETVDDVLPDVERADRAYWEKKATPGFLRIIDNIVSLLRADGIEPSITYNRYHVALGSPRGYNFCWFHARMGDRCHIEIRLRGGGERRDEVLSSLVDAGVDASARQADLITFTITTTALDQHSAAIRDALKLAEEAAR